MEVNMAARASWKGFLKLSLVTVPVKAFTSAASSSEITLNQLHGECHNRIRYKKVCPDHGEVSSDQIVSGYEYSKDQYVIVEPEELVKIRKESDRAIDIDGFIDASTLDPIYHNGRSYYLTGAREDFEVAEPYTDKEDLGHIMLMHFGFARIALAGGDLDRALRLAGAAVANQERSQILVGAEQNLAAVFEPAAARIGKQRAEELHGRGPTHEREGSPRLCHAVSGRRPPPQWRSGLIDTGRPGPAPA
jgi:hypothetical protein